MRDHVCTSGSVIQVFNVFIEFYCTCVCVTGRLLVVITQGITCIPVDQVIQVFNLFSEFYCITGCHCQDCQSA